MKIIRCEKCPEWQEMYTPQVVPLIGYCLRTAGKKEPEAKRTVAGWFCTFEQERLSLSGLVVK